MAIDSTGLHAIEMFAKGIKQSCKVLLLCGARDQPAEFIEQSDFGEVIGRENILPHVQAALDRAQDIFEGFDGVGMEVARDYIAHAPA